MSENGMTKVEKLKKRFGNVEYVGVEHEDRLSEEAAGEIWGKIADLFKAKSEAAIDEVKVSVYAYFAVNGTSRVGKYSRAIVANSTEVAANDVVKVITGGTPREFCRSDVTEAYYALKETGILEADEVFVAKAMEKGVPRGYAHCAVDFLRGCPNFTVEEKKYADAAFAVSITRASVARNGKSLELLGSDERMERVTVGGAKTHVSLGRDVDEF